MSSSLRSGGLRGPGQSSSASVAEHPQRAMLPCYQQKPNVRFEVCLTKRPDRRAGTLLRMGMAWHGTALHGMALDGMEWHGMAWHDVTWHGMRAMKVATTPALVTMTMMTMMTIEATRKLQHRRRPRRVIDTI